MKRLISIGVILFATAAMGLAESWTGKLIDANCEAQATSQANPGATPAASCTPTAATKDFAVQTADGKVYKLDKAGNSKAAAAMKNDPTKTDVMVSGSLNGQMLKVDSIDLR